MGWLQDWLRDLAASGKARKARFTLCYAPADAVGGEQVKIGHLMFDGEAWEFRYDDEYKQRRDLRPIEGFDDLDVVYRSRALFPFFAVRVPSRDRRDIREALAEAQLTQPDLVDMLKTFGGRAAATPDLRLVAG